MIKRLVPVLLALLAVTAYGKTYTLELTEDEYARLIRAVSVYEALHLGQFSIRTHGVTNGIHYRSITAAGQTFRFRDTLTIPPPRIQRHYLGLTAGIGVGVHYAYSLLPWLTLSVDLSTLEDGSIRGGLGARF